MLLSFGVTADAQRVSKRFPVICYWDFSFKNAPDTVDCIYDKKINELFLSGFEADGKGTFWFAGGNPLRVSCFKGTKLQWRRKVSDSNTKFAMFRLRGDSLYLVHDQKRELIVIDKNGKGDVRHIKLDLDSLADGKMYNKYFVIQGVELSVPTYGIYSVSYFNYDGRLLLNDTVDVNFINSVMSPLPRIMSDKLFDIGDENFRFMDYKGNYRGYSFYDEGTRMFLDCGSMDEKDVTYEFNLTEADKYFDIFPFNAITDITDNRCHPESYPGTYILRGTHYYYVGYNKSGRLTVVDMDLDKMFPKIANREY